LYSAGEEQKIMNLSLDQAIKRALLSNRTILNELDNMSNAELSVLSSKADFMFKVSPNIFTNVYEEGKGYGGGLRLTKRLPFGSYISFNPYIKKSEGEFNSGVDILISQPLLKGLSKNYNLSGVYQSEFSFRTARRNLYMMRENVIILTISAVYNIIRQHKILGLRESSYNRLKGYAETAKIKQKKGFATALDVYRATIQLKQAETLLTTSRFQYLDARDNLKIILAIPLEYEIEVTAPLEYEFAKIDESTAISTALAKRVEIEQINDVIRDYERKMSYAKHNLLPNLDLELRYTSSGFGSSIIDSIEKNTGKVEMSFSGSGDITRTFEKVEYERSKVALRSAYRMLSLKRDEITREVKNAIRNMDRLEKNILIHKEQIHEAKGKMELARVKFSYGMANNFDLIESEAQYREAETNFISSIIDYIEGKYRLKAVMGILLDEFGF
jgi:outer membrane protein TolC